MFIPVDNLQQVVRSYACRRNIQSQQKSFSTKMISLFGVTLHYYCIKWNASSSFEERLCFEGSKMSRLSSPHSPTQTLSTLSFAVITETNVLQHVRYKAWRQCDAFKKAGTYRQVNEVYNATSRSDTFTYTRYIGKIILNHHYTVTSNIARFYQVCGYSSMWTFNTDMT